jgi:Flp pilus assembly pilin Flp
VFYNTSMIGDKMNNENLNKIEEQENQKGASLVEYALLVALIAVVALAAISTFGTKVSTKFSQLNSSIT